MKIFVDLVLSSIGLGYFIYGKKDYSFVFLIPGAILMFYSYLIDNLLISSSIGAVLVVSPFIIRKFF